MDHVPLKKEIMESLKKKWFVIFNPNAGNGRGRKHWPKIKQLLENDNLLGEFEETTHVWHAVELVRKGIQSGYRKIMAIGGDGTNNEAVNGIFLQKLVDPAKLLYTLIPVGTGNDWARQHQIPTRYSRWIPHIRKEKIFAHDIGLVHYQNNGQTQKRYFINVAGMGYDGYVGKMLQTNKPTNRLSYLYLAIKGLFEYDFRKAKVFWDDQSVEDYIIITTVGICKYSGGGMQFVPHAIPDDGLLAVSIVTQMTKWEVTRNVPLFYNGKIGAHPKVQTFKTIKLRVEAIDELPTLIEVDGEFIGETPIEIEVLKKALNVVVI